MNATLLILGGTAEAFELAERMVEKPNLRVLSSLAGRTNAPRLPPGQIRIGGFGGASGLSEFLRTERIDAVVDATHPFASRMGWNADRACTAMSTPLLRLERPAWQRQKADRWDEVGSWDEAAERLRRHASRAFLALGRLDLDAFAELDGIWCLIRSVERPDLPPGLAQSTLVSSRGPFTLEGDLALLREHRIDTIACKNSGGPIGYAKIEAARQLGLRVVMRQRPPRPDLPMVMSVAEAVAWVDRVLSD
ncbi:MAG: cobalt-precorrin-6A reductase [Magnetospirillum sp.]|nr:cobalt-precorrin-6A reductase [Magnetospirillum sp.]